MMEESSVKMQSGPNCRIDDFKKAVHAENSRTLKLIDAAQLDVYSNMAELQAENPVVLDPAKGMTQYDANMGCPLVVVAPVPSAAEGPYKKQRVDIDPHPAPELPQIDISGPYVMIPGELLQMSAIGSKRDILLYRRAQVNELWQFLNDRVIAEKKLGYIVGPPGTGKSMATLSFVASLDRTQWRVIWIHLAKQFCSTFLDLGTNKSSLFDPLKFEFPEYLDGQNNLFVCLDGLDNIQGHNEVLCSIQKRLGRHGSNRFVVCSSMATPGKRKREDDKQVGVEFFHMYSWTRDEYREAVSNPEFFNLVKDNLDATLPSDVNDPTDLTSKDYLDDMVDLKFYYAGGSCRYMFDYQTQEVKLELRTGIISAMGKPRLIEDGYNEHQINKLFRVDKALDGDDEQTAVSGYAQSLFVEECGTNMFAQ
ncbi:hypothetical protein AeNC1_014309 [Aphanomyces euteiches]|nr:hypothetical protein AeNC1_014309 [Aphanomyces euteiches]